MTMQNQKKLTVGRSMVEMLGVLAIIGVLSIGGIMGFRRAMDTHHVNTLMNDVSLLGMAVATRDQIVEDADCHNYEEQNFSIPVDFATCKATFGHDDLVVLNVTYSDNMPDRVIHMIENRCTQGVYVSTGATQFIVGPHGWDCELGAAAGGGEEPQQPEEEDDDWECVTAGDCHGYDEQDCINHRCRLCPDPTQVGPEGLSKACCDAYKYRFVIWSGDRCVWDTEDVSENWKCDPHERMHYYDSTRDRYVTTCSICMSSSHVRTDVAGELWCCAENESKSACCSAIGKTWCEKLGACVSNSSDCDAKCVPYTQLSGGCTCDKSLNVVDPATNNTVNSFCCNSAYDTNGACCDAVGGFWGGYYNDTGTCYSEQLPGPEEKCVYIVWGSSNANTVCCEKGTSDKACCESAGGTVTWCEDQQMCASGSSTCQYFCHPYTRSNDCYCSASTIEVSSPNVPNQPYCCSSMQTFQACCEAMGFTWTGDSANNGQCLSPTDPAAIDYVQQGYDDYSCDNDV